MNQQTIKGYDVIGDVHGHVHALEGLLCQMGYSHEHGHWRHPERKAIFVGDLVDRGTHQIATVQLARAMVDAGTALMVIGNHEYNAVAWATPRPGSPGEFCRTHSDNKFKQHRAFLEQVVEGSALHQEFLDWFCTLPLWLEVELGRQKLRVVHACWDDPSMDILRPLLKPDLSLTREAVEITSIRDGAAYNALEVVLKGPEIWLQGIAYLDHSGKARHNARRRWWDAEALTLDAAALIPRDAVGPDGQPVPPLPHIEVEPMASRSNDIPVVVGHYWESPDELSVYSPLVTCVDHSLANKGPLVAYRWSGESRLIDANHVAYWVPHPNAEDVPDEGPDD